MSPDRWIQQHCSDTSEELLCARSEMNAARLVIAGDMFQSNYGKPLLAAKDSKCSAKDAEAGALAMEALHKQVMPFLLRRTKDEVLSDLPEKIIQDRYCDLSPVELKLYEQFSGSNARKEISSFITVDVIPNAGEEASSSPKASAHVFQALQYLLKLCSHPLLVPGERPPDSLLSVLSELMPDSANIVSDLHELHHSPKLVALEEILEECGIGLDASSAEGTVGVGQRAASSFNFCTAQIFPGYHRKRFVPQSYEKYQILAAGWLCRV